MIGIHHKAIFLKLMTVLTFAIAITVTLYPSTASIGPRDALAGWHLACTILGYVLCLCEQLDKHPQYTTDFALDIDNFILTVQLINFAALALHGPGIGREASMGTKRAGQTYEYNKYMDAAFTLLWTAAILLLFQSVIVPRWYRYMHPYGK